MTWSCTLTLVCCWGRHNPATEKENTEEENPRPCIFFVIHGTSHSSIATRIKAPKPCEQCFISRGSETKTWSYSTEEVRDNAILNCSAPLILPVSCKSEVKLRTMWTLKCACELLVTSYFTQNRWFNFNNSYRTSGGSLVNRLLIIVDLHNILFTTLKKNAAKAGTNTFKN